MWVKDKLQEGLERKIEQYVPEVSAQVEKTSPIEKKDSIVDAALDVDSKVEQVSEQDQIKNILQETKNNLEHLKANVLQDTEQDKTKVYIQTLLNSIKNLDANDDWLLSQVEKTIATEWYDNKIAIEQMILLIDDLEKKAEQLSQTDKEKLLAQKESINNAGLSLWALRDSIQMDPEKILIDTKQKAFDALITELKGKWRFPDKIANVLQDFLEKKYIKGERMKIGEKILWWLAVAVLWLAMGKNWREFFTHIDDLSFEHIQGVLGDKADSLKTVRENIRKRKIFQKTDAEQKVEQAKQKVKELTVEEKEKWKQGLETYITKTLKNINGKIPTKEQLNRIIAKVDISENTAHIQKIYRFIATNGVEGKDGNIVEGVFWLVGMPFTFSWQVIEALREENLVSIKDVVFEVWDGVVTYWLKWFKLFGKWMWVAFGQISWSELGEQIWFMYDRVPDQAKVVLASLIYKTQHNPVFRGLLNIAEQWSYILTSAILESGDKLQSISKNVSDVYKNNMSTALQNMEDLLKNLPEWNEIVDIMKKANSQMMDVTKLLQTNIPAWMTWSHFADFVRNAWVNMADLPQWIQALTKETKVINAAFLRNAISKEVPWIFGKANVWVSQRWIFKTLWNDTKWLIYGEANPYRVTDDAARYMDEAWKLYKDVLGWWVLKKNRAKIKLSRKVIEWAHGSWKMAFYSRDVQTAEDMLEQFKFLAKESPSTLKFLIGKTPLFLVWWMAFAKDGTPTEKMKNLLHDMQGLVPIIWPIMIMHDAWTMETFNISQMTTWAILWAADIFFLGKSAARWWLWGVAKYITQPVVDLYEIGKFGIDGFRRTGVLFKNAVSLAEAQWFWQWLKWMWKAVFTKGRMWKMALMLWMLSGLYVWFEYFFWDKIDEETRAKLEEYEKDPNKLDKEVFAARPTLPQEEKNDYLKAAILARGWFEPQSLWSLDVTYDETKKNYTIQIPQVINGDQKELLKGTLTDALSQLQPDATIRMQIASRGIVEFRHTLQEQYKDIPEPERTARKREYIQAIGYDPDSILSA